jgi:hypothetical protein
MAALTLQTISIAGVTPTYATAASGGDTFVNNGRTFLVVKNGHATLTRTITIDSLTNCNQGFDHNLTITAPAVSEIWIGPFEPSRFNNSSGAVSATYSTEANLTVAAITI